METVRVKHNSGSYKPHTPPNTPPCPPPCGSRRPHPLTRSGPAPRRAAAAILCEEPAPGPGPGRAEPLSPPCRPLRSVWPSCAPATRIAAWRRTTSSGNRGQPARLLPCGPEAVWGPHRSAPQRSSASQRCETRPAAPRGSAF